MSRVFLSDAEKLRYLSSGIVSKGLYLQNDLNDSISPRNHLVEIPADVQFFLPSMPETAETFEMQNKEVSEQFGSVLNNGSKSLAIKFFGAIFKFLLGKKHDVKKLNRSKDPYFKKWLYKEVLTTIFIPTASVRIENTTQCKLSEEAMLKLQKLETSFKTVGFNIDFIKQCDNCFRDFGSHYFIGTYHLGGLRKDIRTENTKETNEEEKANHTYYSTVDNSYDKFGGFSSNDDIFNWKRSLVGRPSNWCVIDKEESSTMNYCAVWNLIDADHFEKPIEFSNALEKAWKTLTGLSLNPEIDGTNIIFENQIRVIKEKVEKDIFLLNCTEKLSTQIERETTVSEMVIRVKNNYPFNTWTPGGLKIENREQRRQRKEKEFEMVISRLYDKYLTAFDKTGDVQDSLGKVLESENLEDIYLTSEQEVSETQMFSSAQVRLHQS